MIWRNTRLPEMPKELKMEPPVEYIPAKHQPPVDPSLEAVMSGVESYKALRTAYASLEEHHQQTVVQLRAKEAEVDYIKNELSKSQDGLKSEIAVCNEALRERDRMVDLIHSFLAILSKYDFNPLPAPRKKNGKKVEERLEDPVPIHPEGGSEVREVRDVPPA